MKFIISSSVLRNNLQLISGVINPSNTLPILDDFLFHLSDNTLEIKASDLETTIAVKIEVEKSEEPGHVAIPARLLQETVKNLPDVPVAVSINNDTLTIEISAGEGKFKLAGHQGEDFPEMPELENVSKLSIKSDVLKDAFSKTLFATGNDELRPVMSGVFCELKPSNLIFVATDAHKLVKYTRFDTKADAEVSFIIPKKPLNQLKNILPDEEEVTIEYDNTNAFFSFGHVELVCRLIEGKYPNYEAVIPKDNPNTLVVEKNAFISAIRRVGLYANQSTNQIRLKISGKELVLTAEDIDFSNEAKERLTCNYSGEDMEIGFNAKFLVDMLNNIHTDQVKLELSTPNRAGLLMPVMEEEQNEHLLMLLMPIMLK